MKPKVLCVCSMGLNRSKWVANYLKEKGYKTRYGGIGPYKFDPEPANPIDPRDLEWADIIIAARSKHEVVLKEKYNIKNKKIIVLEVSDSRHKAYLKNPEWKEIIKNSKKEETVLISGHGALNIALLGHFLKIPYGLRWKIKQSNCAINEVDFDEEGDFKVIKINY